VEKAGVENAGVGGSCGKCRSDNGWKAVREEKYKVYVDVSKFPIQIYSHFSVISRIQP